MSKAEPPAPRGMTRLHALAVSLLLALATAAGTWAITSTQALRHQASKPQVASARVLARREKQLDAWQASIAKALRSRPPSLPALPRYARLASVNAARARPLPALHVRKSATARPRQAQPAAPPRAVVVDERTTRPLSSPHGGTRPAAEPTAPVPSPDPVVASEPSEKPPPATPAPPASPTPEQQCEALKRAAESQGEAARRAAEQQCRQLLGDGTSDDGGDDG